MTVQIAVRIPDELADWLDQAVESGQASNRAEVIRTALERERRRLRHERDIAILKNTAPDRQVEELVDAAGTEAGDLWDDLD